MKNDPSKKATSVEKVTKAPAEKKDKKTSKAKQIRKASKKNQTAQRAKAQKARDRVKAVKTARTAESTSREYSRIVAGQEIKFQARPITSYYSSEQLEILGKDWESHSNIVAEGISPEVRIFCKIIDEAGQFQLPINRIKQARVENPDAKISIMAIVNQGGQHWVSLPIEIDRDKKVTFNYANSMGSGALVNPALIGSIERNARLLDNEGFKTKLEGEDRTRVEIYEERWEQPDGASCGAYAFENARRKLANEPSKTKGKNHAFALALRAKHLDLFIEKTSFSKLFAIAEFPALIQIHNKFLKGGGYPTSQDLAALEDEEKKLLLLLNSEESEMGRALGQISNIKNHSGKLHKATCIPEIALFKGIKPADKFTDKEFIGLMGMLQGKLGDPKMITILALALTTGNGLPEAIKEIPTELQKRFSNELVDLRIRIDLIDGNNNIITKITKGLGLTTEVEAKIAEFSKKSPQKLFQEKFNQYKSIILIGRLGAHLEDSEKECSAALKAYLKSLNVKFDERKIPYILNDLTNFDLSDMNLKDVDQLVKEKAETIIVPEIDILVLKATIKDCISSFKNAKEHRAYHGFSKFYNEWDAMIEVICDQVTKTIDPNKLSAKFIQDVSQATIEAMKSKEKEMNAFLLQKAPFRILGIRIPGFGIGKAAMTAMRDIFLKETGLIDSIKQQLTSNLPKTVKAKHVDHSKNMQQSTKNNSRKWREKVRKEQEEAKHKRGRR